METQVSKHDLSTKNLTATEQKALYAYDDFMDRYYRQISLDLRKGLADDPTFGPIIKNTPAEQLDEQDAHSRQIQKNAIRQGAWKDYTKLLLQQGVTYARMGLNFSDWSYVINVYREYTEPYLMGACGNNISQALLILRGLNKVGDYALSVIAKTYFSEKNKLIRQERTEKKHALELFEESESRFQALFENSADHIFMVDREGTINFINHVAPGLTKEEVIGSCLFDYQTDEDRSLVIGHVNGVFETAEPVTYQSKVKIKDGHRHYSSSVSPVMRGDEVVLVSIISRDVTLDVIAEQKINHLNEELEEKVRERTEELKKINEELESFSYSVSHDLRAPIRAIDGFAKVLTKSVRAKLSEKEMHFLDVIIENSARMGDLIDDLLAFSRIGRVQAQMSLVDMNLLFNQVYKEQIQQYDQSHRVTFIVEALPPVRADREMIKVVIGNLIGNALKFSFPVSNPVISIKASESNHEVVYSVSDNGVGFEMDYVHKVFGVFQRLHSDEEFEGTGVGLAIVQRIITQHHGKVWAEGTLNKGAVFYFSLPK